MDEKTWEEARRAWLNATNWPNKRDIPHPAKQSVDIAQWKEDVNWGQDWEEPNDDPAQQDHYATTDWTAETDRGKQNGW